MSTIIQHNQATCQIFNPNHYLVQFVCFETSLPNDRFLSIWQPFVTDFLNKGIELLVLNETGAKISFRTNLSQWTNAGQC
ncbi:unnamed protein product [Rotaria magnacalcarata]|uniref:Uncharacterized protein n=2 Tax=Rotaria magnacalcarata TaxID=392030 RepID=A0A819CCZ0_9BILA|nr:unnamed protein product [Rotaria magnacalcarata]